MKDPDEHRCPCHKIAPILIRPLEKPQTDIVQIWQVAMFS
jgi:hypothetical protein